MTQLILVSPQADIEFRDSGGDAVLTLSGLAAGGARVSAQFDRGAGSIATEYRIEEFIDGFATAPVVDEQINVFIATAHTVAANVDGDLGVSDASAASAALKNLGIPEIVALVQTTTAADEIMKSGNVVIDARFISVVLENATADNLAANTNHFVKLIPMPRQVQDDV